MIQSKMLKRTKLMNGGFVVIQTKSTSIKRMDLPEKLVLHAYDWKVEEELNRSENSEINCWALTQKSKPVLLRILNFPVSRIWQLPQLDGITWTKPLAEKVLTKIKNISQYSNRTFKINKGKFVTQKKLYYYDKGQPFPFISIEFDNEKSLSTCEHRLKYSIKVKDLGEITLMTCESRIDTIRKLLTCRNLKTSSWFEVAATPVPVTERISTLGSNEYYCLQPSTIRPLDQDEDGFDIVTTPGILSFDIEAHSNRHNAFPDKWSATDVITMISIVYKKRDLIRKILITQCECNPLDDVEIVKVDDEIEVIRTFEHFVRVLDPEIITGYNIMGFDWEYMNSRLSNELSKWESTGRIKNREPIYDPKSWSSSAYGQNSINNLPIDGRVGIDMMLQIKRHYKFPKYSLNYVAEQLLGKKKLDVTPREMFEAKDDLDEANRLLESKEIPEEEALILKDDAVKRITKLGAYNIVDSELVLELFNHTNMWVTSLQFSNVFCVPISYLSTRGQQIRVYSQLYDECSKAGIIIDMPKQSGSGYKGAFVMEPKPGRYNDVIVLDFLSLYPTIIISKNICYSTFVPPERVASIPASEMHKYNVIEWDGFEDEENDEDGKSSKTKNKRIKHYKYVFAKSPLGVVPRMLQRLLAERSAVKAALRNESDPVKRAVLDKRQLAIKTSANSVYGFYGVNIDMAILPLMAAAMSVTAMGRILIGDTNSFIEENYSATIVYGDTDSTFVNIQIEGSEESKDCVETGKQMGRDVTQFLRSKHIGDPKLCNFVGAIDLEYEKVYGIFFAIAKKKYMAIVRDDVTGELLWDKPVSKGIIMARRDNCKWQVKVYNDVIMGILRGMDKIEIEYIICSALNDIMTRAVDVEDLLINRGVGSYSATSTYFMKQFADRLRREGKNIIPGDRLDYLIIEDKSLKKVGDRMILLEKYEQNIETKDRMWYDRDYYATNVLQNCIEQLYQVRFGKEIQMSIDRVIAIEATKIREKYSVKFKRVAAEGEELITRYISNNREKVEPTKIRYVKRLNKVISDKAKELRNLPKHQLKWGAKKIYTCETLNPVQNMYRLRMFGTCVIKDLENMENFGSSNIRRSLRNVKFLQKRRIASLRRRNESLQRRNDRAANLRYRVR